MRAGPLAHPSLLNISNLIKIEGSDLGCAVVCGVVMGRAQGGGGGGGGYHQLSDYQKKRKKGKK